MPFYPRLADWRYCWDSCIKLVDVYGDGDSKLIVADADKRLKMYKGEL